MASSRCVADRAGACRGQTGSPRGRRTSNALCLKARRRAAQPIVSAADISRALPFRAQRPTKPRRAVFRDWTPYFSEENPASRSPLAARRLVRSLRAGTNDPLHTLDNPSGSRSAVAYTRASSGFRRRHLRWWDVLLKGIEYGIRKKTPSSLAVIGAPKAAVAVRRSVAAAQRAAERNIGLGAKTLATGGGAHGKRSEGRFTVDYSAKSPRSAVVLGKPFPDCPPRQPRALPWTTASTLRCHGMTAIRGPPLRLVFGTDSDVFRYLETSMKRESRDVLRRESAAPRTATPIPATTCWAPLHRGLKSEPARDSRRARGAGDRPLPHPGYPSSPPPPHPSSITVTVPQGQRPHRSRHPCRPNDGCAGVAGVVDGSAYDFLRRGCRHFRGTDPQEPSAKLLAVDSDSG